MELKLLILVILAILLVVAFIRKLIFLAIAILVIAFAYYTGLAGEAVLFIKEIFNIMVNSPPPVLAQTLFSLFH